MSPRQQHQRRVDALLAELDSRRRRLEVMLASGARPAGLRDLKRDLGSVREELAQTVYAA